MSKQRKWSYEIKVEICERLVSGQSYTSVAKEFNGKSRGMLANWKRKYLEGTLSKEDNRGRKKVQIDDLEILKKCYAQLIVIAQDNIH